MPSPTPAPQQPYDAAALADVLRIYADDPLDDGDAVLLVDDTTCLEVEGLADAWDDVVRGNLAKALRGSASRVVVAIARPGGDLRPGDFRLWRELHQELRGSDVELLPVKALPAA
ncbi:MAG TPA: hypothetical protein VM433_02420 [Mycobacteriales bacterium]|nr:hypothetical protein [Mycobacteriales bacterium]